MVVQDAQSTRVIAQIFVMSVAFNPATKTFTATVPEGLMNVQFIDLIGSTAPGGGKGCGCGCTCNCDSEVDLSRSAVLARVAKAFSLTPTGKFNACLGGFLPHHVVVGVLPNPPYAGQYGDLPFQDPWWKLVLCMIALILAAASAIVKGLSGGDLTVTGGTSGGDDPGAPNCCGFQLQGGGGSAVAAGLAAAATVATIAACSDARDPFRRGQDHTMPAGGASTTAEGFKLTITYLETMQLGKPFAIGAKWNYTRETTASALTYAVGETQHNVHVIDSYDITAPNVVRSYQREPFIFEAKFTGRWQALQGRRALRAVLPDRSGRTVAEVPAGGQRSRRALRRCDHE